MKISKKIGFMQGRLSSMIGNKIQAFPSKNWFKEFKIAKSMGLNLMEWTTDQNKLYKNPLLTEIGRNKIQLLSKKFNIKIESLTGDCFMQAPFWKAKGNKRKRNGRRCRIVPIGIRAQIHHQCRTHGKC